MSYSNLERTALNLAEELGWWRGCVFGIGISYLTYTISYGVWYFWGRDKEQSIEPRPWMRSRLANLKQEPSQ